MSICQGLQMEWNLVFGDLETEWNLVSEDTKMEWNLVVGDTKMDWNLIVGKPQMELNFNPEKYLIEFSGTFRLFKKKKHFLTNFNANWTYGQND